MVNNRIVPTTENGSKIPLIDHVCCLHLAAVWIKVAILNRHSISLNGTDKPFDS